MTCSLECCQRFLSSLSLSLSLSLSIYIYIYISILNIMICMFQDIDKESIESTLAAIFVIVITGSEILRWFSH